MTKVLRSPERAESPVAQVDFALSGLRGCSGILFVRIGYSLQHNRHVG